jgi:Ni/Fe-hydrogenase 1 B-type cytochrome subunit
MDLFRYADDYYGGPLAEQLLLPAAILFFVVVILFAGIHALRRSAGEPVATEPRASYGEGTMERYELGARLYHWGNSAFLMGLAVSGAALFAPGRIRPVRLGWLRIHEIFAGLFIAGLILHIAVAPRRGQARSMWFERRDWRDLKQIWANFFFRSKAYPAFGKYDPLQKIYHACITLASAAVIFTGIFLASSAELWGTFSHEYLRWIRLVHDVASAWFIAIILGHIYFGLIRVNWPELRAMITGTIPAAYLRLYHSPERWKAKRAADSTPGE